MALIVSNRNNNKGDYLIVVKIIGGLGNQMLQYAFGRSYAIQNNTDFKMDISAFKHYRPAKYQLYHFNIVEDIIRGKELKKLKLNLMLLRIFPLLGKLFPSSSSFVHKYIDFQGSYYLPWILDGIEGNIYYVGYAFSEKNFKNIANILRKEFTVKTEPNLENKKLLDRIQNCNSVAIHVRRGDRVTCPEYPALTQRYYKKGIDVILKKVDDPVFFVFSDDSDWAKENIKTSNPIVFVENNKPKYDGKTHSDKAYEDLRLMYTCKHFIISSSFSWWGAWLSQNPDKIVISPEKWIYALNNKNPKTVMFRSEQIVPQEWIKLSVV